MKFIELVAGNIVKAHLIHRVYCTGPHMSLFNKYLIHVELETGHSETLRFETKEERDMQYKRIRDYILES